MSKSKFISVGDEQLHVYDVLHDVFVKHLIDAAERSAHMPPPWLVVEIQSWRVSATVTDIPASFGDRWSEDKRRLVAGLAEQACAILAERPAITAEEMRRWDILDGVGIETRGETEVPTDSVIEVGRAVVTLLRGDKIEPPPGGTWFYSKSGRCVWQR